MLDLAPEYLILVQKIVHDIIPNETVWIYGSRIKGCAHEGSDLDLVIVDSKFPIATEKLVVLRAAFSDSNLPITVDILNWASIPDSFRQNIKQSHLVLSQN